MTIQKITPFLWFDGQAEQAANFYTSVFPNSKVLKIVRQGGGDTSPVMTVQFELDGLKFVGLNGGPHFKFTEAVSFVVNCKDQAEVDLYWNKLSAGGAESQCGWLKDKFGLSWQIVPSILPELLSGPKAGSVMQALMTMVKLDIQALQAAAK